MMINFKPQKGKAFDKLPKKTLNIFNDNRYVVSVKYDGNQIFIAKKGIAVRCFTSDWKEFSLTPITDRLTTLDFDFTLVGEFMYGCEGKLGDRVNSAILTTLRTNFNKGLANTGIDLNKSNIRLFDIVAQDIVDKSYIDRINILQDLVSSIRKSQISCIEPKLMSGEQATTYARSLVNLGYEGCMLVECDSTYHIGKRVNHSIKLKYRKTADLLCIDVVEGTGKYIDKIGALILRDSKGTLVSAGSGLSDADRMYNSSFYIGKIIEIEYEQIIDTYIQPTIIAIRTDKTKEDID